MPRGTLDGVSSVVLIDWPGRVVPDTLARAGLEVSSSEGPAPDDWAVYSVGDDGEIRRTKAEGPPASADLVFSYRPFDELDDIIAVAKLVGAETVWQQYDESPFDRAAAQARVEAAGMIYVDEPTIIEAAGARAS